MSNYPHTISEVMTAMPHGIAADETLDTAKEKMQQYRVRHLPVRTGGHVVGILSQRDLEFLEKLVNTSKTKIQEVMTPDPYCVSPSASLRQVASTMMQQKIGSALIVDKENKLLGIFTDTDALRVLSELLPS